jgi:hypothetical protein
MSLVRLLTAGKSLIGGMENATRYRLGTPGLLPKFGSGKNPFLARGTESRAKTIQPPEPSAAPLTSSSFPTDEEKIKSSLSSAAAPLTPLPPLDGGRERGRGASWWELGRGWAEAIKSRSPRRSKAAKFAELAQGRPVQAELSLDRVKVLRNDLSDTDFEVVPRRPGPVRFDKSQFETGTKAGQGHADQPEASHRLSVRPDDVHLIHAAVAQAARVSQTMPAVAASANP